MLQAHAWIPALLYSQSAPEKDPLLGDDSHWPLYFFKTDPLAGVQQILAHVFVFQLGLDPHSAPSVPTLRKIGDTVHQPEPTALQSDSSCLCLSPH